MSTFRRWYGDHRVRPIEHREFIGARPQIRSPWTATWSSTVSILTTELRELGARDVVLQMDVTESQLRLDGGLRSGARPASHAVALAFESKHGPLLYSADLYSAGAYGKQMEQLWMHNLRAVGMTLQALRAVTRYGVNATGEQYTGNLAIGTGETMVSHEQARGVVYRIARIEPDSGISWGPIVRRAKANAHPDPNGGDRTAWDELQHALKILGEA